MAVNSMPRTNHEVVPENHSETKFQDHPSSTRLRPACRVSNAGRKQLPSDTALRAKLLREPYLTGHYVEEKGRFNFFINQAGRHIECLMAFIDTGRKPKVSKFKDKRIARSVARLGGDYDPAEDEFTIYGAFDRLDTMGVLGLEDAKGDKLRLVLFEDLAPPKLKKFPSTVLIKVSDRPALFERYIAHPTVPSVFRTHHWFALTPQQTKFLRSGFVFDVEKEFAVSGGKKKLGIEGLVDHYFKTDLKDKETTSAHIRRLHNETNAHAIERFFVELQSHVLGRKPEKGGIHEAHMATLVVMTRFHLARRKLRTAPDAHQENLVSLIARIVDDNPLQADKNLRRFGFVPGTVTNKFEVEYDIDGAGGGIPGAKFIGGSAWAGFITLKKTEGAQPFSPSDGQSKRTFGLVMASADVGIGTPFQVINQSGSGEARSFHEWFSDHIPGKCLATGVGAAAAGGIGVSFSLAGDMFIPGDQSAGAPASPLSVLFPPSISFAPGLGASAGISEFVGEIFELKGGGKPKVEDATAFLPKLSSAEYVRILNTKKKIHFCTNDAQLTEDAKHFIETMAALELPAFEVAESTFKITGYTDREGTPFSNIELSIARASNVQTYLDDILVRLDKQGRFKASFETRGAGEPTVGPDDVKNPKFRRVNIVLDGKLLLALEGVPDGLLAE